MSLDFQGITKEDRRIHPHKISQPRGHGTLLNIYPRLNAPVHMTSHSSGLSNKVSLISPLVMFEGNIEAVTTGEHPLEVTWRT